MSHKKTSRKTLYLKGNIVAIMTQRTEIASLRIIFPDKIMSDEQLVRIKRRINKMIEFDLKKKKTKESDEEFFRLKIPYSYENGVISQKPVTIRVDNEYFEGWVKVWYKFFLSKADIETNKAVKAALELEKYETELEYADEHPPIDGYAKPSELINYKNSNIRNPYKF